MTEGEPEQAGGPPEEWRVLFAAAQFGRADIISQAIASLKTKYCGLREKRGKVALSEVDRI